MALITDDKAARHYPGAPRRADEHLEIADGERSRSPA